MTTATDTSGVPGVRASHIGCPTPEGRDDRHGRLKLPGIDVGPARGIAAGQRRRRAVVRDQRFMLRPPLQPRRHAARRGEQLDCRLPRKASKGVRAPSAVVTRAKRPAIALDGTPGRRSEN